MNLDQIVKILLSNTPNLNSISKIVIADLIPYVVFSNSGFFLGLGTKSGCSSSLAGFLFLQPFLKYLLLDKGLNTEVTKSIKIACMTLILAVALSEDFASHFAIFNIQEHPLPYFLVATWLWWRIEIDVTKKPMTKAFIKYWIKPYRKSTSWLYDADKTNKEAHSSLAQVIVSKERLYSDAKELDKSAWREEMRLK